MKTTAEEKKPQARKQGLLVQPITGEVLVYDRQSNKAHCLNESAAAVWKHCDGKTTITEIAGLLEKEFKQPVEDEVVLLGLDQLWKARLLEQKVSRQSVAASVSRRQLIKRIGLAAAVALPLVTSIVAPRAAEASTCVANGGACVTSNQCCSLNCSAGGVCV